MTAATLLFLVVSILAVLLNLHFLINDWRGDGPLSFRGGIAQLNIVVGVGSDVAFVLVVRRLHELFRLQLCQDGLPQLASFAALPVHLLLL